MDPWVRCKDETGDQHSTCSGSLPSLWGFRPLSCYSCPSWWILSMITISALAFKLDLLIIHFTKLRLDQLHILLLDCNEVNSLFRTLLLGLRLRTVTQFAMGGTKSILPIAEVWEYKLALKPDLTKWKAWTTEDIIQWCRIPNLWKLLGPVRLITPFLSIDWILFQLSRNGWENLTLENKEGDWTVKAPKSLRLKLHTDNITATCGSTLEVELEFHSQHLLPA